MIYKYKKKLQRKMNRDIKKVNQTIREDDLWKGRFEIRQIKDSYCSFKDGSGGILTVKIRMIDKKSRKWADCTFTYSHHFNLSHLLDALNYFIVEYIDVWTNETRDSIYSREDFCNVEGDYHLDKPTDWEHFIKLRY